MGENHRPDTRGGRFAAPRTEECLSDGLEGLQSAGMTTTLPPAGPDAGTDPGDPIRARTIGGAGELLSPEEITRSVRGAFSTHISHLEAPVRRVLSIMPTKYEDIRPPPRASTNSSRSSPTVAS